MEHLPFDKFGHLGMVDERSAHGKNGAVAELAAGVFHHQGHEHVYGVDKWVDAKALLKIAIVRIQA